MPISPTIQELTKGEFNCYELVVAVAKGTRMVTDEENKHRECLRHYADETLNTEVKRNLFIDDEKPMATVIKRMMSGEYKIVRRENENEDNKSGGQNCETETTYRPYRY